MPFVAWNGLLAETSAQNFWFTKRQDEGHKCVVNSDTEMESPTSTFRVWAETLLHQAGNIQQKFGMSEGNSDAQ